MKSFSVHLKTLIPERVKRILKDHLGVPSLESSFRSLRQCGFKPGFVIDIGAYHGDWTVLAKSIWPTASVLMLEASPDRAKKLAEFAKTWQGVTADEALLGPVAEPSVPFYEQESASSALPEWAKDSQPFLNLPMRTLDQVVEGTQFAAPDFLKLDVQGFELAVLRGGLRALQSAEAVLLEVNLMEIYKGAPLLNETVTFMEDHGMLAYDFCTFYRRPLDNALWQVDMVFVRKDSPLRASQRWE